MELLLTRHTFGPKATLGDLDLDGRPFCHTLELPCGDYGKGYAIPTGRYKVIISPSARFNRLMPRVLDVPGRSGILIHKGNTSANTEGCVLVGMVIGGADYVARSTEAYDRLWLALTAAGSDDVWLTVREDRGPEAA